MKKHLTFTAYNRPSYIQSVIESWNAVRGLQEIEASFYIEPSEFQNEIADIVFELNTTTTTVTHNELQGVLTNPWGALNDAFEAGAEFVILAEDDVIVSQDALEFFDWAATEYQTAHSLLAINAFSSLGSGKDNQVYTDMSFSPLVWGTWRDRWEETLRDSWDKDYSTGNPDGSEAGWDWNINRIIQDNNLRVLRPVNSRSDHIGEYGGTHMTPDLFSGSRGASFEQVRGRQRYNEI